MQFGDGFIGICNRPLDGLGSVPTKVGPTCSYRAVGSGLGGWLALGLAVDGCVRAQRNPDLGSANWVSKRGGKQVLKVGVPDCGRQTAVKGIKEIVGG